MSDEAAIRRLIELADDTETGGARASSRLKSRIYSRLMQEESAAGALRSVSETKASGRSLCVFEQLVHIAPIPNAAKSPNFCRVCHARIAAENIEAAPIYWPHCPYVSFQGR